MHLSLDAADPNGIVGGTLRVSRLTKKAHDRARSSRPADSLNTGGRPPPFVPTGNMMVHAVRFHRLGRSETRTIPWSHDVEVPSGWVLPAGYFYVRFCLRPAYPSIIDTVSSSGNSFLFRLCAVGAPVPYCMRISASTGLARRR